MSRYEEPPKRKKSNPVVTFISTFILIVALGVFGYAAFTLYGYYKEYKAGTDEYKDLNDQFYEDSTEGTESENPETENSNQSQGKILTNLTKLEDPATLPEEIESAGKEETKENGETKSLPMLKNPIDFASLQEQNEEVIGWLRISALDISYPIAQAADNDYYLHRTFLKEDNFAGCIFLNCDNSRYFTDQNSVIYGHNMKNGSMFGTLKDYRSQETWDKCRYFWVFTADFIYQYEIFSCAEVASIGDPYKIRFTSSDFAEFLEKCQSSSLINTDDVQVTEKDRIVTLSTCTSNSATRLIVQGRLKQVYVSK